MKSKWIGLSTVFFVGLSVAMFALGGDADGTKVIHKTGPSFVSPGAPEVMSEKILGQVPKVTYAPGTIIWDNGMDYISMGASQYDPSFNFEPILADDFIFEEEQEVSDVHWIGGYWNPSQDGNFAWEIKFYNDFGDGTKPGAVIATYAFANHQVNEALIESTSTGYFCSYSVDLPAPLSFNPDTKYWISIQGIGTYPPQSGWAMHESILLHEAVFKSQYFGYPDWTNTSDVFGTAYDMCFQLTAGGSWPNHKMHFPQLPDLIGWDVNATYPKTLADDWQCSQTGPVTDIHFWGSWKDLDGIPGTDDYYTEMPWFILSIHANLPEGHPANPYPWSIPGELLWRWEGEIPGTPYEPPTLEGWFDPNTGEWFCNDHVPYWQYDFDSIPDPFIQIQDSIYWLNISAQYIEPPYQWGWKNSRDHFMDDAVYTDNAPDGPWYPMIEPPRNNWFDVYFNSDGVPEDLGSTNYFGGGWYQYEYWWNMWFYNNPFVYNPKHIWLEFYIDPAGPEPYAEFAINWSTDLWYYEGVPGRPPLPGEDERLYIGRQVFSVEPGYNTIDFWLDYNPEWVSIDFVATDVIINGWIWHECMETSLDLAFVITGEAVEELDFGDCPDPTYPTLLASDGARHTIVPGIFLGASIDPEADGQPDPDALGDDNDGSDDEDGVVFTSLVIPGNTVNVKVTASVAGKLDAWVDFNADGDWADAGEQIFNNTALAAGANFLNFTVPSAAATRTTYSRFRFSTAGGLSYTGAASDGEVEDYRVFIQEPIEDCKMHWPQLPDLDSTGMDVDMYWAPLADDYLCTESGPVTDIHFWGSFADDSLPAGGVDRLTFQLQIHANIPAGVVEEWSMPGEILWGRVFGPGEYEVHQKTDNNPEDWYDPVYGWWFNDNHLQVYQYNFFIDTAEAFVQDSGTIYWLSVKDILVSPDTDYTFGWKTTPYDLHWNDDAVWLVEPPAFWLPLYYPPGHEWYRETIDLAFVITGGEECPCGDCNGDGRITGADATYILNYIYRGGPGMVCNCDVNLDGRITGADATYIINYIYRGGPPPCNPPLGYSPYSDEPATVVLQTPRAENGIVEIPVTAEFNVPLAFTHLEVTYDPTMLEPLTPELTSRTEGLDLFCEPTLEAGRLKLGMLSLTADRFIQPGDGPVVMLRFKKLAKDADISNVRIEEAILVDEQSRELKTTVAGYCLPEILPTVFSLSQNYPNPLSSGTDISYALPKDVMVRVEVYNALGERVKTLVDRQESAGYKVIHWDGTDESGGIVAPGIYFYRIVAHTGPGTPGFTTTKKMIVLR